jgi:hypothetical protein
MKQFTSAFMLVFLLGCGGGSGDSKDDNSADNGSTPTDLLSSFMNIEKLYTGKNTPAIISVDSLGTVYEYITVFTPELLPSFQDEIGELGTSCSEGGNLNISDGKNANEKVILFENCSQDGMTTNGKATVRANKFSTDGELIDSTIIFENIKVSNSLGNSTLAGTAQYIEHSTICPKTESIYNLMFTDTQTSQQLLFSNFTHYRTGSSNVLCSANNGFTVRGKVYDSNAGVWTVNTTIPFQLKSMVPTLQEAGQLIITGSNQNKATLTINTYKETRGNFISNFSYYDITLNPETDNKHYIFLSEYLTDNMLLSFEDDDNDGLTNNWELAFGLNPTNSNDAALDSDGDSYSNLEEYLHFGHPKKATILPRMADLSIMLQHETTNYSNTIIVNALVNSNVNSAMSAEFDAIYTTQLPTTFDNDSYASSNFCQLTADQLILSCHLDGIEPGQQINQNIYLTADKQYIGEINSSLSVTVKYSGYETNPSNDSASIQISRRPIDVTYGFVDSKRAIYSMMLENSTEEVEFAFSQLEPSSDRVEGIRVLLNIPSFMSINTAQCYNENTHDWYNCLLNNELSFNSNQTYYMVKLSISGQSQGQEHLGFTVKSETTKDAIIGQALFPVIVGKSSQIIQQQIDIASNGSSVTVPAGIFLGELDLAAKQVSLKGDNKKSYLYYDFGDQNSGFFNPSIKLGKQSSISNFTLANHLIHADKSGAKITNNIFDGTNVHLYAAQITNAGELYFEQNKMIGSALNAGYANSYSQDSYHCPSIKSVTYETGATTQLHIINNIYLGNLIQDPSLYFGCNFIEATSKVNIEMSNNTLLGLGTVLRLDYGDTPELAYQIKANNNIVSQSRLFISNTNYAGINFQFSEDTSITLTNNVFNDIDMLFEYLLDKEVETGTITADPLLDETGYPLSNSPAIDAGVWSDLAIDIYGTSRPIDGDNNGSKLIDIGAIEFKLN